MTKRIIGLLLSVVMLIGLLPMAAFAEDCAVLTFNETVTANVAVGESCLYQFTAPATQSYVFYSTAYEGLDPFAVLLDSTKTILTQNDDYDGRNFRIVWELTAGETYYLEVSDLQDDDAGTMQLTVGEILPTLLYVDPSEITCFVGAEYTLETAIHPTDAVKAVTWTSSDESVATVDENGKVTCLAGGKATITATTRNGLTDTCDVTVKSYDGTVAFGETTFLITEDEATKRKMLKFTPAETGYYRLFSFDNISQTEGTAIDPRVEVYSEEYDSLVYSDDQGGGLNFRAELFMEAGKNYYCEFSLYYTEATGSFKLMIEKMLSATSATIDHGDRVMEQGESDNITVTYAPEGCWIEDFTMQSSDETVVAVRGYNIDAVGAGEATVTVTTENGLTDSITVTVNGAIPLTLNTPNTLVGVAAENGGWAHYCFTPTVSGRYTIASSAVTGEGATAHVVLSELGGELRRNETGTAAFSLTYELQADTQYYFDVTVVGEASDSTVEFMLTEEDDTAIPEVFVNTEYTVDITNPGDGAYFIFKPTVTGNYTAKSFSDDGEIDPKLLVFDENWKQLVYNDDGADDQYHNYWLEWEFQAGETYYLKSIIYHDDRVGSYTMSIQPTLATLSGNVSGVEEDAYVTLLFTEEGCPEPAYEVIVIGNGSYTVEDMPLATYTVNVSAEGYKPFSTVVVVDGDTTLDIAMEEEEGTYSVLFYLDADDEYAVFGVGVDEGYTVTEPAEPGREGMAFIGWYVDGVKYDFSAPVMSDLKLVATFVSLGDMSLDGSLNTMDALLLFSGVNGRRVLTAEQEAAADFTGDGKINMMDALQLYRTVSGR